MRKLMLLTALGALVAVAAPQQAVAATTIGNGCSATTGGLATFVQIANGSNPLPLVAPAPGIVTSWGVNSAVGVPVAERLKILRPTGVANQFKVIAASDSETVTPGESSFDARLAIEAGDRVGAFGVPATLVCIGGTPADIIGQAAGDQPVGSTPTFTPAPNISLALTATIEPDADGDGYGDETQDGCTASKDFQDPCPVIVLDTYTAPGAGSLTVLVTTDNLADVTVTGSVKVKKAKGGKGKRKSAKIKLKGGTQTVRAGALARFRVPFPKALKKALAKTKKPLKATLSATATDVIGRVSSDSSKAKLAGTK